MLVSLVTLPLAGCAGMGDYWKDRALDFTDVFDVKAGYGLGLVGAKVEVTDYVGTGLGIFMGPAWEKYGRDVVLPGGGALWLGIFGADGVSPACQTYDGYKPEFFFFLFHCHGDMKDVRNRPPLISRFRVGAEAFCLIPWLGFYLNLGELADFITGFTTLDIAGDDEPPPEADASSGSSSLMHLTDKRRPYSSKNMPAFTWYGLGENEWVSHRFHEPKLVSWTEVYWYDEPQRKVGVPESWQLLWLDTDGETWHPVATKQAFGVELDNYNRVEFEAVETLGLKIVVQFKEGFSSGILGWKYGD